MAKLSILAGATSQSINIFVQNSSVTTGAGLTGFATAGGSLLSGMIFYYSFAGAKAASVVQSLSVPATVGAAFSAGSIVEIDATHMPGVARLDLPNAMLATSNGRSVVGIITGGTNVAPIVLEIELTAVDNQSTAFGLSLAKTTNITGFNDIAATAVVSSGAITTSGGAVSTVTTVTNQLTAAAIATGIWQDSTSGDFTAAASIGKALYINAVPGATGGHFIAGTNAATTITTSLTTTFTGSLTGSVASVSGAVGSVTGAVGSVTGAVGSVTGNVGGNVVGSVASVTGAVGSVTGNVGGTVATVTNLTNAPTAGDFTSTMKTSLGTAIAASAVASVTGNVGGNVTGSVGSISGVTFPTNFSAAKISTGGAVTIDGTSALTEAYSTVGSAFTLAQGLYDIHQLAFQKSISGTTQTVQKRDGATTAKTMTLNSSTAPTSAVEAS